jgi:molecular chaperone GrpE
MNQNQDQNHETDPNVENEVFEESIQASQEEAKDDYKNKYLLLLADMENTRKRMLKEKQDSIKYSLDRIVSDFLIPMDNLEGALKFTKSDNVSSDVKNWAFGFEMILGQFKEALSHHGVTSFESLGQAFDPNQHQAIEMVEVEGPENIVIEECVKGYKREDRIIRPARVKVSKKITKQMET